MPPHEAPSWLHTEHGLVLRLGTHRDPVPEPISRWLIGPAGLGLSGDAAEDVLRVEGRLRQIAAELAGRLEQAEHRVAAARAALETIGAGRSRRARARRRPLEQALRAAIADHTATSDTLAEARTLVADLRSFVIGLHPPEGPLREAATGWRRSPDPPASVVVFADEQSFLDGDPRRVITSSWGGPTLAGLETFGLAWRRDGDEDDPAALRGELSLAGPWQIGHLSATSEIYAIRRCGYLPRQVWLLGTDVTSPHVAHDVLRPIMGRMREPNSLILAAETLHTATTGLAASNHRALAPRRTTTTAPITAKPTTATVSTSARPERSATVRDHHDPHDGTTA